ncbi:MAG: spondin domain-containing protein [Chitinophagaceae bacterium]
MKTLLLSLLVSLFILSCKKSSIDESPAFSDAVYSVEFTGKWKAPEFGVPAGVHFTTILGMIHNNQTYQWKLGELASWGVERIAESGNTTPMVMEIDSIVAIGKATSYVVITAPTPTGSNKTNIFCNSNYSFISFETMLAPTPDWFTGISSFNLYANNKWVTDTTVDLYSYDAGTETGDVFGYDNPETSPKEKVHILTPSQATVLTNGNGTLAPIASVRFIKN